MARYGFQTEKKAQFLDWLMDPVQGEINTMAKWAKANHVNKDTPRRWKQEPEFRKVWERELAKRNIDPGRIQKVVDAMHNKAVDGDTVAAKMYLEYVARFAPPPTMEDVTDVSEMSDDELDALIAEEARNEASRRSAQE